MQLAFFTSRHAYERELEGIQKSLNQSLPIIDAKLSQIEQLREQFRRAIHFTRTLQYPPKDPNEAAIALRIDSVVKKIYKRLRRAEQPLLVDARMANQLLADQALARYGPAQIEASGVNVSMNDGVAIEKFDCQTLLQIITGLEDGTPKKIQRGWWKTQQVKVENLVMRNFVRYIPQIRQLAGFGAFLGVYHLSRYQGSGELGATLHAGGSKLLLDNLFDQMHPDGQDTLSRLKTPIRLSEVFLGAFTSGLTANWFCFPAYAACEAFRYKIPAPVKSAISLTIPHFGAGITCSGISSLSLIYPHINSVQELWEDCRIFVGKIQRTITTFTHPQRIPLFFYSCLVGTGEVFFYSMGKRRWKRALTALVAVGLPVFLATSSYPSWIVIGFSGYTGAILLGFLYSLQLLIAIAAMAKTAINYHKYATKWEEKKRQVAMLEENFDPNPEQRLLGARTVYLKLQRRFASGKGMERAELITLLKEHVPSLRCYTAAELEESMAKIQLSQSS